MYNSSRHRKNFIFKAIAPIIIAAILVNQVILPTTAQAQGVLNLPVPGTMITTSQTYRPTLIKGMTLYPENPLKFDFIVHPGDSGLSGEEFQKESSKLIKYFLAALTVPEKEMWVNLSPYEKDRIIPKGFGDTEMGRDLLAQDYMLKQLTASLMYPEEELGNNFWNRVYEKANEKYGTSEIPMNTFNKVWIVPESATILEKDNSVLVVESHLKVLLEEDYLALDSNIGSTNHGLGDISENDLTQISEVSSEIIREIIIPEIEREVNQGKTFAKLRQISNSVILATWYKKKVQGSILKQVYIDKNKTLGVDTKDKGVNQKIYDQYVEAFKKGVYNFIREDYDSTTQEMIPRKYFSGGAVIGEWKGKINKGFQNQVHGARLKQIEDEARVVEADLEGVSRRASLDARVPDESDGMRKTTPHDILNSKQRNKIVDGDIIDFSFNQEAKQLKLDEDAPLDEPAIEARAGDEYQEMNLRIQNMFSQVNHWLEQVTAGNVPESLKGLFPEGYFSSNDLESRDNLIQLLTKVLNLRLRIIKNEFFVDEDGDLVLAHAGRDKNTQFGHQRIWMGERAVKNLDDQEVLKLMIEDGLHFLRPDDEFHETIHHDTEFLKKIGLKLRRLRGDFYSPVTNVAQLVSNHLRRFLVGVMGDKEFATALLDQESGALKDFNERYKQNRRSNRATLIGTSGRPGVGKSSGVLQIANEVAKRTGARVVIFEEDRLLIQKGANPHIPSLRKVKGGKYQAVRKESFSTSTDEILDDLKRGRSVLIPSFDSESLGNPMLSLNEGGEVVIHNGIHTYVISYAQGDSTFSYRHIIQTPGKEPEERERKENIDDTGVMKSSSSRIQIRIDNNRLVIGFQSMEIVGITDAGVSQSLNQLTEHEIELKSSTEALVKVRIPEGNEYLKEQANFRLEVVRDATIAEELDKAKWLLEFISIENPFIFDGQFAFIRNVGGKRVKDAGFYDVPVYFRAARIIRWVRAWLRSAERGRTQDQQFVDIAEFEDKAGGKDELSVQKWEPEERGGVVEVITTDLSEMLQQFLFYHREHWLQHRFIFEQMGIDIETFDQWQRENVVNEKLLELLELWRNDIQLFRRVEEEGFEEYQIGHLVLRLEIGRNDLDAEGRGHIEKIRKRSYGVVGAHSLLDLQSLGNLNLEGRQTDQSLRHVTVWNSGDLVGDRLNKLAEKSDQKSFDQAKGWIDDYFRNEGQLHARGIVDTNPNILSQRRILTIHGKAVVANVSPDRNLKIGREALDLYEAQYTVDGDNNIYLQAEVVGQIPELVREYYIEKAREFVAQRGASHEDRLRHFYVNTFEVDLLGEDRMPVRELPEGLQGLDDEAKQVPTDEYSLRNGDVEHPILFKARLDHMRYLVNQFLFQQLNDTYFNLIQTNLANPQVVWTELLLQSHSDKYSKFYRLAQLFGQEIRANHNLFTEIMDNDIIAELVSERYDQAYRERGVTPVPIDDYSRQSFNEFLDHLRALAPSWDEHHKKVSPIAQVSDSTPTHAVSMMGVQVQNQGEFERLVEMLSAPKSAVVADLDGTVEKVKGGQTGNDDDSSKEYNRGNHAKFAQLANDGVLIAVVSNRRQEKIQRFADVIRSMVAKLSQYGFRKHKESSHSDFLAYWAGASGAMDAGKNKVLEGFELKFYDHQKDTIIPELDGIDGVDNVDRMQDKINIRTSLEKGAPARRTLIERVEGVLEGLGYLSEDGVDVESTNTALQVKDAGRRIISIVPAEADKSRAKQDVKNRFGFTDDQILSLVDEPQKGGVDFGLTLGGAIHVGENAENLPEGVVSTKKAIGLTGPEAVQWILQNTNFVSEKFDLTTQLSAEEAGIRSRPELLLRPRPEIAGDVRTHLRQALPIFREVLQGAAEIVEEGKRRVESGEGVETQMKEPGEVSGGTLILTETDLSAQKFILNRLLGEGVVPGLPFRFRITAEEDKEGLGELIAENNLRHSDSDFEVILDPLDGTSEFAKRNGVQYGILLSLKWRGEIVAAFWLTPKSEVRFVDAEGNIREQEGGLIEASELENGLFVWRYNHDGGNSSLSDRTAVDTSDPRENSKGVIVHKEGEAVGLNMEDFERVSGVFSMGRKLALVALGMPENPVALVGSTNSVWDVSTGIYFVEKAGKIVVKRDGNHVLPLVEDSVNTNGRLTASFIAGDVQAVETLLTSDLRKEKRYESLNAAVPVEDVDTGTKGGIDLNPAMYDLQINQEGSGFTFPVNQIQIQETNIDGFVPVIINVSPAINLQLLFSEVDVEQTGQLSYVKE